MEIARRGRILAAKSLAGPPAKLESSWAYRGQPRPPVTGTCVPERRPR